MVLKNYEFCCTIQEELIEDELFFNAYFVDIGGLEGYYGHFEYDAKEAKYKDDEEVFEIKSKADFI
jgi:hypothetical protein